jgi:hypothetical protein
MFSLVFTRRYSMAHQLMADAQSKCAVPHGHNELVTVKLQAIAARRLDGVANMVEPFEIAKGCWRRWIDEAVDHALQLSDRTRDRILPAHEPDGWRACWSRRGSHHRNAGRLLGGRSRLPRQRVRWSICGVEVGRGKPTNTDFSGDPADVLPERPTAGNRADWW